MSFSVSDTIYVIQERFHLVFGIHTAVNRQLHGWCSRLVNFARSQGHLAPGFTLT